VLKLPCGFQTQRPNSLTAGSFANLNLLMPRRRLIEPTSDAGTSTKRKIFLLDPLDLSDDENAEPRPQTSQSGPSIDRLGTANRPSAVESVQTLSPPTPDQLSVVTQPVFLSVFTG